MTRTPDVKELINTRLANHYGGWIYCESCSKTIGYLCYVTYDDFSLAYRCNCGGCGNIHISFHNQIKRKAREQKPITMKNRLCCSSDSSPLFTLLTKNLNYYKYKVLCAECHTEYTEEQTL